MKNNPNDEPTLDLSEPLTPAQSRAYASVWLNLDLVRQFAQVMSASLDKALYDEALLRDVAVRLASSGTTNAILVEYVEYFAKALAGTGDRETP